MKKHPFLQVDMVIHEPLTGAEKSQVSKIFEVSSLSLIKVIKKHDFLKTKEKFKNIKLSLLLCGEKEMKKLNMKTRAMNKVTDVLSFPFHEDLRKNSGPVVSDKTLYLGEMAICHAQAKKQAKKFGIRYKDEFTHLFVHGIFHLLGYDHDISSKEEALMQKMEDAMLDEISRLNKKIKKKGS